MFLPADATLASPEPPESSPARQLHALPTASIALARAALAKVKRDDVENDAAIDRFRKGYYSDAKGEVR